MKITQDVRDYAATLNDPANVGLSISGTIEDGMATMSAKFKEMGSSVYLDGGQGEGEQSGVVRHRPLRSLNSSCPAKARSASSRQMTRVSINMKKPGESPAFFNSRNTT